MKILSGVSAVPGIVIGRAFLYRENLEIPRYAIAPEQCPEEITRFIAATEIAAAELQSLKENTKSKEQEKILTAYLLMTMDSDFHYKIKVRLESLYENIEWTVFETARELSNKLMESSDNYLRERAEDLADVSRRIIKALMGKNDSPLSGLDEDVILVARHLHPSDVLAMNKDRVKAVLMDSGSLSCHTAVFLRSFVIPSVLGLSAERDQQPEQKIEFEEIFGGSRIIVDAGAGQVFLDPDEETVLRYEKHAN